MAQKLPRALRGGETEPEDVLAAQGMIMGTRTSLSMLLGALLGEHTTLRMQDFTTS